MNSVGGRNAIFRSDDGKLYGFRKSESIPGLNWIIRVRWSTLSSTVWATQFTSLTSNSAAHGTRGVFCIRQVEKQSSVDCKTLKTKHSPPHNICLFAVSTECARPTNRTHSAPTSPWTRFEFDVQLGDFASQLNAEKSCSSVPVYYHHICACTATIWIYLGCFLRRMCHPYLGPLSLCKKAANTKLTFDGEFYSSALEMHF